MNDLDKQIIKIIDSLGDVNKQAFFRALRAMFADSDRGSAAYLGEFSVWSEQRVLRILLVVEVA